MFYLFEVEDKAIFDDSMYIFIKAEDDYEAEERFNKLFPAKYYRGWLVDEYTEREAKIFSYEIF